MAAVIADHNAGIDDGQPCLSAAAALALLQRIADGDRSMSRPQLRRARETVATLVRVQQQTDRLRTAVRTVLPAAAD
jgi:hypothetical protein